MTKLLPSRAVAVTFTHNGAAQTATMDATGRGNAESALAAALALCKALNVKPSHAATLDMRITVKPAVGAGERARSTAYTFNASTEKVVPADGTRAPRVAGLTIAAPQPVAVEPAAVEPAAPKSRAK